VTGASALSHFLAEYGLFLAKTLTWTAALLVILSAIGSAVRHAREMREDRLEIRNIGERLRELADRLNHELLDEPQRKMAAKERKREAKARRKSAKHGISLRPRVFVLQFDGDMQAHAVAGLREEISAVLQVARDGDELLLRLESGGGLVHAYGLAASQLARLKPRKVRLTVAVDKVAASGGYLMACVADHIIAAPFAVIGSIGVVAQLPNFNRLLKKNEIDIELHTAGEFKRTLTVLGENTEAARAKFREELEDTHLLFKAFVAENRPDLDMAKIATGEHWYGTRALELKLVDELSTSDDYLLERVKEADVFELRYRAKKSVSERIGLGLTALARVLRRQVASSEPVL
jgi:serine protease SohB